MKFQLAEKLGKTVGQIETDMSPEEFLLWAAYFKWKSNRLKKK